MEWPMVEAKSGTNPAVFGAVKSGFRVFGAMNRLQGFTRNRMGYRLLSMLMTLCSLGKHWKGKPHTIPVAEIREIWEAASDKGRYTNKAMWATCAKELEEYQAAVAAQSPQHGSQ